MHPSELCEEGLVNLREAVLSSVLKDCLKLHKHLDTVEYIESRACEFWCELSDIDHQAFKERCYKIMRQVSYEAYRPIDRKLNKDKSNAKRKR